MVNTELNNSMINLMYFFNNYSIKHFDELMAYVGEGQEEHIRNKFNSFALDFDGNCTRALHRLFFELSTDRQEKFVRYVNRKYSYSGMLNGVEKTSITTKDGKISLHLEYNYAGNIETARMNWSHGQIMGEELKRHLSENDWFQGLVNEAIEIARLHDITLTKGSIMDALIS